MDLELINQITGTGANSSVMLLSYILWNYHIRIKRLEDSSKS
jgi:hypothetical protein